MPPKLALFICVIYVFLLLRLERKQTPNVSWVLWIPTVWMLVIASKPLGTWFGSGHHYTGSPLDQIFLSILLFSSMLILVSRKFKFSMAIKENAALIFLIAYMLVSVLWSEELFDSIKRWIRELIVILMAFLVRSERDPRQAMQSLFKRSIYVLIPLSLLLIKYFPEYGIQYRSMGGQMWIGATLQKNGLGRLCLISAFFLIWTLVQRWKGKDIPVSKYQTYADLFVLMLTLFIMSGPGGQFSATAIASLGVGLVVFIGLLWSQKHRIILGANSLTIITILIFGLGALQPFMGGSFVKDIASNFGRDVTLTGRTEIWASLLPDLMRQPFFGHGFASFWTPMTEKIHDIGEAHSGYLEVMLDTGFLGLILLAIFLISYCRKAQRLLYDDYDWGSLSICFLLMAMIHNISESSINSFTSQLTAVLLFLAVSSSAATSYASIVAPIKATSPRIKFPSYSRKKKTTITSFQRISHR